MLGNGATPTFIEFKNSSDEIVTSISTSGDISISGDLSVVGSVEINGTSVPQITVSDQDPTGGVNGDLWIKVV